MTEWKVAYHKVLGINRSYNNIARTVVTDTNSTTLNKKLRDKNMKEYHEAVNKVFDFLNERGNL